MRMKKRIFLLIGLAICYGFVNAQSITWAHLQWEAATTVQPSGEFEALGLVFANGITNVENPVGTAIEAQLGYGPTSTPTDASWTWKDAPFNCVWGQNLAYQVKTTVPDSACTLYYSFRFKLATGGDWAYAGTDGLWDATEHPCKTFTVYNGTVYSITWAHLQWEAATTVTAGNDFEALGLVYAQNLTDATVKDHNAIVAQMGYGTTANPTDQEWTWKDAAFNCEWGNNFGYQDKIATPAVNGTYYYSFRFKINQPYGIWAYAGVEGLWDATDHPCKTFTVTGGTDPAGIQNVKENSTDCIIYDMMGQRLSTPQQGLNIINGQKVFIK